METFFTERMSEFWIQIMEKLSMDDEGILSISEVIKELCQFFEFGCSFIYHADHKGTFTLHESFKIYTDFEHLTSPIELEERIGRPMVAELALKELICFDETKEKSNLEIKLHELFRANSLLLVPIVGEDHDIIALVGMADRRGRPRRELDIQFTYSVLVVMSNHIKLQMYRTRIEQTQQALESIVNNMGVDIYVNDFYTHEVLYVNRSMAEPYGGIEKMLGKICWQVLYEDKTEQCTYCPQFKLIDKEGNPTKIYSWDYQRPFDGSWFRVLSAAFQWVDGRLAHIVSSIDITENKTNEEMIRRLAEYDILTGLPNRHRLFTDCDRQIEKGRREEQSFYIMFFDLDKFKLVNDHYGHRAGDELLSQIGVFLQAHDLTRDKSYRYGGDEFVLLCDHEPLEDVLTIAELLTAKFSSAWELNGAQVYCNTSIGVTRYPADGENTSDLLNHADAAMYAAKSSGEGQIRFYNKGVIIRPPDSE